MRENNASKNPKAVNAAKPRLLTNAPEAEGPPEPEGIAVGSGLLMWIRTETVREPEPSNHL